MARERAPECPVLMQWTAPTQRHRNVSIRYIYGPTACYSLAFAERQLMAKSCRQPGLSITSALTLKAAVSYDTCLRLLLTQTGHGPFLVSLLKLT
jgi:hypothetical protein